MRKLLIVLVLAFPALTMKAQITIYEGVHLNVGSVLNGKKYYFTKERADEFRIVVNEPSNVIHIQSGKEQESWITIAIERKEIDKNGDFLYQGCATFDGIKKPVVRNQCICDFIILNDEIVLYWGIMVYNYYRGPSPKWGMYK